MSSQLYIEVCVGNTAPYFNSGANIAGIEELASFPAYALQGRRAEIAPLHFGEQEGWGESLLIPSIKAEIEVSKVAE